MNKEPIEEVMQEEELETRSQNKSKLTIKYVRYLLLLVMVMVALIFLFANRSQINGDNFRRLIAKFNLGISVPGAEDGEVPLIPPMPAPPSFIRTGLPTPR